MLEEMLRDVERLVCCESPSSDDAAVRRSADVVARVGAERLGAEPERTGSHLLWRLGIGPTRVLLLGHHDTVWPLGTLQRRPFAVRDGVLTGPGCLDMKSGVVMALHAAAALPDPSGVAVLVTADEELGSPTSRELVEQAAAGCDAVLVLEASADDGALKTERKGVSQYRVRVHGRAAHAGLEPEQGVNATVEIAHQVLAVQAQARGTTTVTPTVLTAGTTSNTVPAHAELAVDVRVPTAAEQHRVDTAMRDLRPVAGGRIELDGGPNRPPLEAEASRVLFERARRLPEGRGLRSTAVGGASDGNLTAGVGVATLDGLGATGGGAHAEDEHVMVAALVPRTRLLTALLTDLLTDPVGPSVPTTGTVPAGGRRP